MHRHIFLAFLNCATYLKYLETQLKTSEIDTTHYFIYLSTCSFMRYGGLSLWPRACSAGPRPLSYTTSLIPPREVMCGCHWEHGVAGPCLDRSFQQLKASASCFLCPTGGGRPGLIFSFCIPERCFNPLPRERGTPLPSLKLLFPHSKIIN